MIDLLRYFGLPFGISTVSGRIDEIIVIVHYLMLVLFLPMITERSSTNRGL